MGGIQRYNLRNGTYHVHNGRMLAQKMGETLSRDLRPDDLSAGTTGLTHFVMAILWLEL